MVLSAGRAFRLSVIIAPLLIALLIAMCPLRAHAANIVVSGTSGPFPCNETRFKAAIVAAGCGTISFNCSPITALTLTSHAVISGVMLVIDGANGGGPMTLSGGAAKARAT